MHKTRKFALLALFVCALALFHRTPQREAAAGGEIKREKAPTFALKLFNGAELKSSDLHGKLVVLKFMASW